MNRLVYDSHMHTPFCRHACGEPTAYAEVAEERGLKGIVITCHTPLRNDPDIGIRMRCDELADYVAAVKATAEQWAGRLDVLLGLESDFVAGQEAFTAEIHQRADFDFILGSVHPQDAQNQHFTSDILKYQRRYFAVLADAAETGLFDALSHPDLIKIFFPDLWNPETVMDDVKRALDRIERTGIAMEFNTSGLLKPYPEMHPNPLMLKEMHKRSIPVVLGSDSHEPKRVGADFDKALKLLKETGYQTICYFKKRKRFEIGIDEAAQSLGIFF